MVGLERVLQGIGALTVLVVLISAAWGPVSGAITMNSTGGVDILKVLTIEPSSGNTVNMTGDLEIEKSLPAIIIDSTDTSDPYLSYQVTNNEKSRLIYDQSENEFVLWDAIQGGMFKVNFSTGDITKMGKFTQNVEIEKTDASMIIDASNQNGQPTIAFHSGGISFMDIVYANNTDQFVLRELNPAPVNRFIINMSNGDINTMGKFTQNVEIEKQNPILTLDATSPGTDPRILFSSNGGNGYQICYSNGSAELQFLNATGDTVIHFNQDGDVTQAGRIEVGDGSNQAQGTLKSNTTGLYVYTGTEWSQIKAY